MIYKYVGNDYLKGIHEYKNFTGENNPLNCIPLVWDTCEDFRSGIA